tara:strand:- start:1221 stop:1949 length:729 start_codon:yes stop_codon:yes gene_type:complete
MEKITSDAIAYRRSVRLYKTEEIDSEKVKQCLRNASIAPTSSNLQLWEFHHITSKDKMAEISTACFNQSAAKSSQQMVAFVSRKDLWKNRAEANLKFLNNQFDKPNLSSQLLRRKKQVNNYYKKIIPSIYTDLFGILGLIKFVVFHIIGFFRPIYRQSRLSDMRIVAHKSTALAAQNFMISMAAIGYDTCPMEGFDSKRVKNILNLPSDAEITMIISCGIRDEKGVYGAQFRVPFEDVYFEI